MLKNGERVLIYLTGDVTKGHHPTNYQAADILEKLTLSPIVFKCEMTLASFNDFMKLDIRCGTIVSASHFPEARKPAVKLDIDFGASLGRLKSSAQITIHYQIDTLVGKQVMAVVNLPPRQIGPFISEVLTLGVADANGDVVLIAPDQLVPNGGKLF